MRKKKGDHVLTQQQEQQVDVLSNTIDSLVELRAVLAGGKTPDEKTLNAVMRDYHRVGVLCVNLHPVLPDCFKPMDKSLFERLIERLEELSHEV